jgi:hypothetical protein
LVTDNDIIQGKACQHVLKLTGQFLAGSGALFSAGGIFLDDLIDLGQTDIDLADPFSLVEGLSRNNPTALETAATTCR